MAAGRNIFYHGSPQRVSQLLPPALTGNIRPSEESRTHHRDVIFLTSSLQMACNYAGPSGYVYLVSASNPRVYDKHEENSRKSKRRKNRRKKWARKRNNDVRIAKPEDIKLLGVWAVQPRRRNEHVHLRKENYYD